MQGQLSNKLRRAKPSIIGGLLCFGVFGSVAWGAKAAVRPKVADQVEDRYVPARFDAQVIHGLVGDRLAVNIQRRLIEGVDVKPLLQGYRKRPGQQTWIGEHAAKFIDAATNAWAYSGDERLKQKVDSAVKDLLATQHPASGLISYFVPLNGVKEYGSVSQGVPGVSCCTSSVPRGLALIPSAAWGGRRGGIAVNLYVPGTVRLQVAGGEVTLVSTTRFPAEGEVALELKMSKPIKFPLSLRVPAWCKDFAVTAGGKTWTGTRGDYLEIDRTWNNSDAVKIRMDLTVQFLPGGPAYPDYVAVQRGPQVLAAEERLNRGADLWIAGVATPLDLREAAAKLPQRWVGSQAYTVRGYTGNSALGKKPLDLVLAPIADAGQVGGDYRVWLQRP